MQTPMIQFSPVNTAQRKQANIRTGDRVRVMQKIVEKGKTRLQPFEGLVIARKHGSEPGATFTVRRTTGGYGVEKVFPLYSPVIEKIEVLRRSKVRQSNIYHVRRKVAREIRREMRRMTLTNEMVADETELQEEPQSENEEVATPEQTTESGTPDTTGEKTVQDDASESTEEQQEEKEEKTEEK